MKPGTPQLHYSRLLDQLRERIRYMHYSLSTEKVDVYWVRFFVRWSGRGGQMRHPRDIGAEGVEAFLTMRATERRVFASIHNQALSALPFLYPEVLAIGLPWLNAIHRTAHRRRIPIVLPRDEVAGMLAQMNEPAGLLARLLYGTGMRLMEVMRLRIKDVDFARHVIIVRETKGGKDRVVMLPRSLAPALRRQMLAVRCQWKADRQAPRSCVECRHHLYEDRVPHGLKKAVALRGVCKPVSVHTLLHSFATHLLQSGTDIRTVQELLEHSDVSTTMIYTRVLKVAAGGTASPLDQLVSPHGAGDTGLQGSHSVQESRIELACA